MLGKLRRYFLKKFLQIPQEIPTRFPKRRRGATTRCNIGRDTSQICARTYSYSLSRENYSKEYGGTILLHETRVGRDRKKDPSLGTDGATSNSPFQRKFRLPSSWDDDGSGGWIGRVVFHSANEAQTTWRIMISPWWWDSAVKCTYGFDWWTVRSRRKMDKFLLEYRWMGWKLWAVAHFFVGLISIFVNKLWSINTISRCDNYVQFSAKICIISSTQFHSLINGEGLEIFHPLFSTSMRKVRSVNRMVECTSVEKTRLQKG